MLFTSCKEHDVLGPLKNMTDTTILKMYTGYNSILPSNQVNTVHSNGNNVWMGTAAGLVWKNGTLWTLFNTLNSRIPENYITAIETDNHQNVWVGTSNGIAIYDGRTWKDVDSVNHKYFINVSVNDILYDAANDLIWIATSNGLLKYDKKIWTLVNSNNSSLVDEFIIALAVDKTNRLVVTTFDYFSFSGRLWYYDFNTWSYVNLKDKGVNSSIPENIMVSSSGNIYLTCSGTVGANLIEIKNDIWKVYSRNQTELLSTGIRDVIEFDGKIILGSPKGLLEFNGSEFKERVIPYDINFGQMMVSDLEIGSENIIYMATYNNGLCEITIIR